MGTTTRKEAKHKEERKASIRPSMGREPGKEDQQKRRERGEPQNTSRNAPEGHVIAKKSSERKAKA